VHGGFKSDYASFVSYSNYKDLIDKVEGGELLSDRSKCRLHPVLSYTNIPCSRTQNRLPQAHTVELVPLLFLPLQQSVVNIWC
jgi:hypothetical protein